MRHTRLIQALMGMLLSIMGTGSAWSQQAFDCGELANGYGPFDYTDPVDYREKLPIVEGAHFTPEVEALIKGSTGSLWRDLDYTLRAFPNHHRALYAVARYALQPGSPPSDVYSPDCYFQRALAFKPDDGMVHMIYGIFLHKRSKFPEALTEYKKAVDLIPSSAEAHYNLGLLYVDLHENESAKAQAIKAYELGYPLQGLKDKLRALGAWN